MTANSSSKMAFKRKKGEMPSRFEREAEGADLGRREKTYRSDLIAALAESSDSDREPEDPIRAAIVQRRKRANEEVGKHSKHEEEPQTLRDVEEEDEEGDEEEVEEEEEEGEDEGKEKKSRRGRKIGSGVIGAGKSWTKMAGVTAVVGLDRSQLGPTSLSALEKQPEKQAEMRWCVIPAEYPKDHYPGLLSIENSSNLKEHFKSYHPQLFAWMEKARKANDDMNVALQNFLSVKPPQQKNMQQMKLSNFAKRANVDGLEPGAIKEIAHALKIVGTDSSFNSAADPVVKVCNEVLGVRLPGAEATRDRVKLIAQVVRTLRRDEIITARFFSTTFDFASVEKRSFLLITYHIIAKDFRHISSFGLDAFVFPGSHYASHIAIAAQDRINLHSSNDCVHVCPTPDGAADVQKAAFIMAGNIELLEAEDVSVPQLQEEIGGGDAGRCFAHAEHLLISACLGVKGQLGTAKLVSRDLLFVHSMAVYFATYDKEAKELTRLQMEDNVAHPLIVLGIECETRWNDREIALGRFLALRTYIEDWYVQDKCPYRIDTDVYPDALMDSFWLRVAGAHRVLAVFARWSSLLQTEQEVIGSWLPRCVQELRGACIRIEGGIGRVADADAVAELKSQLLQGISQYLEPHLNRVSAPLKAAVMDPNEANLAAYGIDPNVIDDVWLAVAEEVENYAPTHKNIAKMLISDLRLHMEKLSRAVQEGGQRHDVLEFWRSMKEIPPEVSFLGPTFSETARAILTIQLSSASSERRVKALKHILTNERTHLGNVTAEDILVVRDWIKQETFTKDRFNFLIKRINEFVLENK